MARVLIEPPTFPSFSQGYHVFAVYLSRSRNCHATLQFIIVQMSLGQGHEWLFGHLLWQLSFDSKLSSAGMLSLQSLPIAALQKNDSLEH